MKILQVIPYFTTEKGGEVNVVSNLSKELVNLGHEVTILTSDFEKVNNSVPDTSSVELLFFKTFFNFRLFIYTPSMKKWLKENLSDYDIVHLHGFRTYQNNIVVSISKKFNKSVILQPHGSFPKIVEKFLLKSLFDLFWGKKIIEQSKYIIAVSGTEQKQLLSQGYIPTSKIVTIPNGIDGKLFEHLPDHNGFRDELGISDDTRLILYLGRLHKRKGIDFLISAFAEALKKRDDLMLVVSGPDHGQGSELQKLVEELDIKDKVIFSGKIDDVRKAYVACDLLVYPSIYEIFGLVPFEGLMCGTPVIVTNDCGCGEIIGKADCGLQVKYGDISGLRDTMIKLIEDNKLANKIVTNGQTFIFDNLLWEQLIHRFLGVYEDCVHNI